MKRVSKARPHPSPLPRGEGESSAAQARFKPEGSSGGFPQKSRAVAGCNETNGVSKHGGELLPLLGERAGERAGVTTNFSPPSNDFLLWQLSDSAFPTGGFAHSAGLEAAWQHGEVRNRTELLAFSETNLHQLGRAALPFVNTAYDEPARLAELDQLCDAFLSNHVANRASRLQGRAFLTAVERIFMERGVHAASPSEGESALKRSEGRAPFAHFAPVFGACLRQLHIPRDTAIRLFFFNHLRGVLASAVRLNIVGPMEAQVLQHRLASLAEAVVLRSATFTLDDLAQTAPLLDLWQGAQDRLYSRLFQT